MRIREFLLVSTRVSAFAIGTTISATGFAAVTSLNNSIIPAPNPAKVVRTVALSPQQATSPSARLMAMPRSKPSVTKQGFDGGPRTQLSSYAPASAPVQGANPISARAPNSQNALSKTAAVANAFPQGLSTAHATGSVEPLKTVLQHVKSGRLNEALRARNALPDNLDRRLADWFIMLRGGPQTPVTHIAQFAADAPHWPTAKVVRARGEAVLAASNLSPAQIIGAFGKSLPETTDGKLALAKAHLKQGNRSQAADIIRPLWQKTVFEDKVEAQVRSTFGKVLRQKDHRLRAEMLLYRDRARGAERLLSELSRDEQAYIKARIASIRDRDNALSKLKSVPRSMKSDSNYQFALIQHYRLKGDYQTAAKLMQAAPTDPSQLLNRDGWWKQRRDISREMIEAGKKRLAYTIAANHAAESPGMIVEAEFHAGWFALRHLNDPKLAEPHFQKIAKLGKTAQTLSRAYYWLGRTREAQQDTKNAIAFYQQAGAFQTSYYGQLALAKLGINQMPLAGLPQVTASDRASFNDNELVQAIKRLDEAGMHNDTLLFYTHLARTLPTNGQIRLLTELAETRGVYQWSTMVGRLAQAERAEAAPLAYPTNAIPRKTRITKGVEKPVVYAIARQESSFNPKARSSAGALGLLQLMPGTAKETAHNLGVAYKKSRLTSDPAYNATLGAAVLGELVNEFGGSYILTFAAYNAGKNKVKEWIERFGDPRNPNIDPIDWVESIPYGETRNYVQRITENLQVYRYKLENTPLTITQDLTRGY
ncbi:Soluble lytic murein transglycosylase precursor [Pseudovibrio axinellae]|uniref:Soluble lytic murein transglycosylase n=1 Tax=Pseudovibrio axinellae TaxID=989403 RepID=A0A165WQ15_9HYPH|nr:transglycosylase SLT domain-containing protein [Pseudovibrio axinellae]KZL16781.1 Soluble lytic murein transglycosylase precursor [Pseudovibrio axinellae]SEQ74881.1 soluble lytic murein transglycosylase [Pseudovibrio axinellae]